MLITRKKNEGVSYIWDFLNRTIGVDVCVDDYFLLGNTSPRPIVVVLQTIEDKRQILQNKKKLKGVKTMFNRPIFINEYLPPANLEKRKREQDIAGQYEDVQDAVTYQKGGMCVNGTPYRKRVEPPTPKEMIDISTEQLDSIFKMKANKGKAIQQDNSIFIAYTAEVENHDQINNLYKKIKMIQPDARHVVCAYWIDHPEKCYAADYHDDGEPAAGRMILDILTSFGIQGKVVFVARRYGGIKMGAERFTCYVQAAKSALGIQFDQQPPNMPEIGVNADSNSEATNSHRVPHFRQYGAPRGYRRQRRGYSRRGRGYGRGGSREQRSEAQYQEPQTPK